ncbi:MAG: MerR family transcriptional regulator [Chloroflexota bacterium]
MTSTSLKKPSAIKFTIGELAEELGITTRTIRYYEERGMITPGRTDGGQRFYTRRERGRLKLILRGKAAGFDLQEIKDVMELYDVLPDSQVEAAQAERIVQMIERRVADLDIKIEELIALKESLLEHKQTVEGWR